MEDWGPVISISFRTGKGWEEVTGCPPPNFVELTQLMVLLIERLMTCPVLRGLEAVACHLSSQYVLKILIQSGLLLNSFFLT